MTKNPIAFKRSLLGAFKIASFAFVFSFFLISHVLAHGDSVYSPALSATDATKNAPISLASSDITSLATSDTNRYQISAPSWPKNASSYDESHYLEFVINPNIPTNATIHSVTITNTWQRSNTITGAKLEIWDGSSWNNTSALSTPSDINSDITQTIDSFAYINTPAKTNSLKFRFLAYSNENKNVTTSHNFVQVHIVYAVNLQVVSVTLSPNTPKTNDTVTAAATVIDPDGDPLTLHYQWKKNGSNVGTDSPTLDLSQSGYGDKGDSITVLVTATDGFGGTGSLLSDPVVIGNTAPVVTVKAATISENSIATIDITGTDADADALTYSIPEQPSYGNVIISGTNAIYTPNQYWNGTDTFYFEARDAAAHSVHTAATVTVTPLNYAPIADDQVAGTTEHVPVTITLPGHDPDIDQVTPLSYSIVTPTTNGTLSTITDTNKITYTPTDHFNGTDTFTYNLYDGEFISNTATVTVTVGGTNDQPYATDGTLETDEDTPVTISLVGGDIDGEPVTYSILTPPSHGSLGTIFDTNKVTYTPDLNWNGSGYFLFQVNDGHVDSNVAIIRTTVNPVNDAPVILPIHDVSINEGSELSLTAVAIDPESATQTLTFAIVSGPTGATLDPTTGAFAWTPTEDQGPGNYPVTLSVSDGIASATESFTITANEVNTAPVVADGSITASINTSLTFNLNATDADNNNTLTYIIIDPPYHGSVSILSGNIVDYAPVSDFTGDDSFKYAVSDGSAYSNIATVTVHVLNNTIGTAPAVEQNLASGGVHHICTDPRAVNYEDSFGKTNPAVCIYTTPAITQSTITLPRTLKLGMVGDDVKFLQVYLNVHGFPVTTLGKETKYFGIKTKKAVQQFQKAHKLKTDGVVGTKTRALMI